MAEIRLNVSQDFVDAVNANLTAINGTKKELSANQIAQEALAVYKWAVENRAKGNAVVAVEGTDDGKLASVAVISTPAMPAP